MTRLQTLVLALPFCFSGAAAFASTSNDLVEKGWKALEPAATPGGGPSEAEMYFKTAIDSDKSNTRAYLGLSLLYEMQERKPEAWNAFRNVLTTEKNY
ncbi:hypothetical protein FBQ87_12770, partial [Sphingobacteriales bacterium CHB3]|nr:hypothetical protein [Sphingobacteriales bacterium CHB3]